MKDIKVTFTDDCRDFAAWVNEKASNVLRDLCRMIDDNCEILDNDSFNMALSDSLKIYALFHENLNGIYCDNVIALLKKYGSDGYNFLDDVIHDRRNSNITKKMFQSERNEDILALIEENNKLNRTRIAEILFDTDCSRNQWVEKIQSDLELVHNGEHDWDWFYQLHKNDRNSFKLNFDDILVQEVYEYFRSDEYKNADSGFVVR